MIVFMLCLNILRMFDRSYNIYRFGNRIVDLCKVYKLIKLNVFVFISICYVFIDLYKLDYFIKFNELYCFVIYL